MPACRKQLCNGTFSSISPPPLTIIKLYNRLSYNPKHLCKPTKDTSSHCTAKPKAYHQRCTFTDDLTHIFNHRAAGTAHFRIIADTIISPREPLALSLALCPIHSCSRHTWVSAAREEKKFRPLGGRADARKGEKGGWSRILEAGLPRVTSGMADTLSRGGRRRGGGHCSWQRVERERARGTKYYIDCSESRAASRTPPIGALSPFKPPPRAQPRRHTGCTALPSRRTTEQSLAADAYMLPDQLTFGQLEVQLGELLPDVLGELAEVDDAQLGHGASGSLSLPSARPRRQRTLAAAAARPSPTSP